MYSKSEAREAMLQGMTQAIENANKYSETWGSEASNYLDDFLQLIGNESFLAEDVRKYANINGFYEPPSNRAWGHIMQTAAKQGKIEKIGYGITKSKNSHLTPATLWRKHNGITPT